MNDFDRVFAPILAAHGMPQSAPSAEGELACRRALYVSALRRMDWQFEHSDDQRKWRAGCDELKRLRAERAELDPSGNLWRKHAHEDFRHA